MRRLDSIRLKARVSALEANALIQAVTGWEWSSNWITSPTDGGWIVQEKVAGRATLIATRDGRNGVRLHTEPGDNNVSGSGTLERCDMYLSNGQSESPLVFSEGDEFWFAHSIFLPDDFSMPTWQMYVLADFHHTDPTGQANFHINNDPDGNLIFRGYGGAQDQEQFNEIIVVPQKNVWYDFVYHVKWSATNGFFDAWVNGVRKLSHVGPTLYTGQGVYFKLANYHTPVCDPYPACIGTHPASSVIHDRVVRGTSVGSVALTALG